MFYFSFTVAWGDMKTIFPETEIKGCALHWGQAVMRKVANLGLKTTYDQKKAVHIYIRKVLSLPFLPADHIGPAFQQLSPIATSEKLQQLMSYLKETWVNNTVWNVRQWSVFRQSVRTNNDVEDMHYYFPITFD